MRTVARRRSRLFLACRAACSCPADDICGGPVMVMSGLICNAARVVATGLTGAIAYDGVKRVARSGAIRGATVAVTAWGLRGLRAAETGAENARLATAGIVSAARRPA